MKNIFYFSLYLFSFSFISVSAQTLDGAVGFAGDRSNTFILGSQDSVDVWLQWCELHQEGDAAAIAELAGDNIRIEAPGGELVIEGKQALKDFLTQWFADNEEVSVQQEWGVPVKFVNDQGTPINGDWLVTGFSLRIDNGESVTVEDNHANVFIENGKVQYFKVFQHRVIAPAQVTLSVDMNSYEGDFSNVGVFGSFNNWCGTCDSMTDEDGDGVYTTTVEVFPGEMQYKFVLDNQSVEESFQPDNSCTKTTDVYTNRVAQVEGSTILDPVCFNTCEPCQ